MKIVLLSIFTMLVGCATVRVVKSQPGKGGVIAVQKGIFGDADKLANDAMTSNCKGAPYDVVEEGEAVVGSTSSGSTEESKNSKSLFTSSSSTTTTTKDTTEWRRTYVCAPQKTM